MSLFAGTTNLSWQETNHVSIDAYNLLMHITFLSALDYRIAPTLLGVDWTLSIEMFWYFLIPSILLWGKGVRRITILTMMAFIIYIASHLAIKYLVVHESRFNILHWSPVPYALGFLLGIVAFRLREMAYDWSKWGNSTLILLLMALLLFMDIPISIMHKTSYIFFTIASFALILFGSKNNYFYRLIFANPIILILGTLSYGIYLCHITFLEIMGRYNLFSNPSVKLLSCIAVSVAVSAVMFFVIERPALAVGKAIYLNYHGKYLK